MSELHDLLQRASASTPVLIALDFDGTIAPIVEHPSMAAADPAAVRVIQSLHGRAGVRIAIVSGRGRRDLRDRLRDLSSEVPLVGSHGAELHDGTLAGVREHLMRQLPEITATLREVAAKCPGAWVELKPVGAALHVRHAETSRGITAIAEAVRQLKRYPGVRMRLGICVLDISASIATKAGAVARLQLETHAQTAIFFGDDSTDEEVFLTLSPPSVGVRVGHGMTYADARVSGIPEVVQALEFLDGVRAGSQILVA